MSSKEKLSVSRMQERNSLKEVLAELKRKYPKLEGGKINIKFIAWFDTDNHHPGKWYVATTCFHLFFRNPTYKKVVKNLLNKNDFNLKNVNVIQRDIHVIKNQIIKSKYVKVL